MVGIMKLSSSRNSLGVSGANRGIVLLTVLIALIIISLSAVSLVRSVDTGTVIAGNLAFRQATTQAGDGGTEAALAWIKGKIGADVKNLYVKDEANNYYATWMSGCDLTGNATPGDLSDNVKWTDEMPAGAKCNMKAVKKVPEAELPAGYSASYVINRLCDQEGDPTDISCEKYSNSTATAEAGLSMAGGGYAKKSAAGPTRYFYRVTTRVVGPRNTISVVQTVLLN